VRDRNKTEETHKLTQAVAQWLDEKGAKPVETEVPVARKWIADLAGVIHPTQTELIELKLIKRKPSTWLTRSHNTGKFEPTPEYLEWAKQVRELTKPLTIVVEVKTTRADFKGDRKWTAKPVANLMWVATPTGLLKEGELPEGWGLLELGPRGLKQVAAPTPHQVTMKQQFDVTLAVAVRRDHHTRYARLKTYQQADRLEAGASKTLHRVQSLAKALMDVVEAKEPSSEACFAKHRIKLWPEDKVWARVQNLYGKAR
jgi:hypothetical protein